MAAVLVALPAAQAMACDAAEAGQPAMEEGSPARLALDDADRLLQRKEFAAAAQAYRDAARLHPGECVPCWLGRARAHYGAGEFEDSIRAADAVCAATAESGPLAAATNVRGLARLSSAHGKEKLLREAEADFRRVVELVDAPLARFNLGLALLRQGRDEEGVAELEIFLARDPASPRAAEARSYVARPRRAREKLLTDIGFTTLSGEVIAPDALEGRVVLLDFWGTWCPPCRNAVPLLKRLHDSLQGRPFTLISIAVETEKDDVELRRFVAGNGMNWPQVWDKTLEITDAAAVDVWPTYVLIGPDGEILSKTIGESGLYRGHLRRRLEEALHRAEQHALERSKAAAARSVPPTEGD